MNDDFNRIMRESNENMSRMNDSQNAQQIANSISSAAAQINQGNENRAHERYVQELRMGMVNATTDRQYRALEILLQEENERWHGVLRKRKRNMILGIVSTLIIVAIIAIFVLYIIGRDNSSYETVHNNVSNQQTTPIQKSVTHSSSTEEAEITKDSKPKEITTNELNKVDTKKLTEEQATEWVKSIVEQEQYLKGVLSGEKSYIYRCYLKEDSLLYIDQCDDYHIIQQYRINAWGQLERNIKAVFDNEPAFELISKDFLDTSSVQDYLTKFDLSLRHFDSNNILSLNEAISYIAQSFGQNYSINNAETYQDGYNFYVSLDLPSINGAGTIRKSYKVYQDGSIDKKVGDTYISVLKRNQ